MQEKKTTGECKYCGRVLYGHRVMCPGCRAKLPLVRDLIKMGSELKKYSKGKRKENGKETNPSGKNN